MSKQSITPTGKTAKTVPAANIDWAEKLVEQMGIRSAFERKYATLDDVKVFIWRPTPDPAPVGSGMFQGLRHKASKKGTPAEIQLPRAKISFAKFRRLITEETSPKKLEVFVPARTGAFFAMTTAAVEDAKPIFQWDGILGCRRNPVCWYFPAPAVTSRTWNLPPSTWVEVTGLFTPPHKWQVVDRFDHFPNMAMFALKGAQDVRENGGLALFPECMRSELHQVRKVIEAYSEKGSLQPATGPDVAAGIAYGPQTQDVLQVRLTTAHAQAIYHIDRWE